MARPQSAVAVAVADRQPIGPERQTIQEERQAEELVLQQLEAQFAEVHPRIGHRLRLVFRVAKQHRAEIRPHRPVAVHEGIEQRVEVVLANAQLRQEL